MLRSEGGDAELRALLARVWRGRTDRYSEKRSLESSPSERIEMSYVGG
jgi:cyclic pyranopterin phosphate synthase